MLLQHFQPGTLQVPGELDSGSLKYPARGFGDFRSCAIAWYERYCMRHEYPPFKVERCVPFPFRNAFSRLSNARKCLGSGSEKIFNFYLIIAHEMQLIPKDMRPGPPSVFNRNSILS